MTTPACPAPPSTLHTFSPSLSQEGGREGGRAAAPSFLGDQRNWGMGVGWSQEPRRPASQPWAQALPLSLWGRRIASSEEEKVGQCQHGVGVWEVDCCSPFSM